MEYKRVTDEVAAEINKRVEGWSSPMFNDCSVSSKSAIREFLANEQGMSFWGEPDKQLMRKHVTISTVIGTEMCVVEGIVTAHNIETGVVSVQTYADCGPPKTFNTYIAAIKRIGDNRLERKEI